MMNVVLYNEIANELNLLHLIPMNDDDYRICIDMFYVNMQRKILNLFKILNDNSLNRDRTLRQSYTCHRNTTVSQRIQWKYGCKPSYMTKLPEKYVQFTTVVLSSYPFRLRPYTRSISIVYDETRSYYCSK